MVWQNSFLFLADLYVKKLVEGIGERPGEKFGESLDKRLGEVKKMNLQIQSHDA